MPIRQMTHTEIQPTSNDLDSDLPTDVPGPLPGWTSGGLFGAIAGLMALDMASDLAGGAGWSHLGVELAVLALALVGLAGLLRQVARAHREARALGHDLGLARADAARWRAEAAGLLAGLGAAIDRQFEAWGLTPAEREVGLLLLKGLALREVGQLRGTSERTVRQQALGLYRKAGVAGRAELAAFFLEDLLLPNPQKIAAPEAPPLDT